MDVLDENFIEKQKSPARVKTYKVFLILLIIGFPISTLIAWWEVESIVGSGPTMTVLGIVALFLCYKFKNKLSIILSIAPIGVSVIWLLAISFLHISPAEARTPVPVSLTLISIVYLILGIYNFKQLQT
jgi:membrane-bound acyltransferase YfiQ involved in biofilm formation